MRSLSKTLFILTVAVLLNRPLLADPLTTAKHLAETKYQGWTYGSSAEKMQVNCVQFVAEVVEDCVGTPLSDSTRDAIFISTLTPDEQKPEKLSQLVLDGDRRTKGVQTALIDLKRGEAVEPKQARPGDLIQYWMKPASGKWYGHAGVIEEVFLVNGIPEATILGAHKSQNGVHTSKFKLKLIGAPDQRRIYIVRMREE